jgi:hypothetical protein
MGLTYNKEFQSKDRRILVSGPRDRQIKQALQATNTPDQTLLIEELRSQIGKLQEQLDKKISVVGSPTDDQINEEIIKAVKSETQKLQDRNDVLSKEIAVYIETIHNKDILIQSLTNNQSVLENLVAETNKRMESIINQISLNQNNVIVESNRPKMETVFVDPIEGVKNVEKHFEIEESVDEKVQMDDKFNKLKGLLGKLPTNKV